MCYVFRSLFLFFFFKQKTAYEMRISDWSSDVCSSDLLPADDGDRVHGLCASLGADELLGREGDHRPVRRDPRGGRADPDLAAGRFRTRQRVAQPLLLAALPAALRDRGRRDPAHLGAAYSGFLQPDRRGSERSEEHTSELQSLMRISYAVFCLTKTTARSI